MARSFERKVRKNMQQLNKQRKKQGKQSLNGSGMAVDIFRGRNITVPVMLIGLAVIYLLLNLLWTQVGMRTSDWLVFVLYIVLAGVFFIRRPYLKVDRNMLYTLKGGRERSLSVDTIKKIRVEPGYVIVEREGRGGNWVFSRTLGRYDTDGIRERLEQFAQTNQIAFITEKANTEKVN